MSEEDNSDSVDSNKSPDHEGPTALAQVMANILASSHQKKNTAILSKSNVDEEKPKRDKALVLKKRESRKQRELAKLAWERMAMVKPSIEDKDRERNLTKIATKGVVQLFNAVSAQQDRLRSKLSDEGTTDLKRTRIVESLSRSSFIDLLKTQSGVKSEPKSAGKTTKSEPKTEVSTKQPKWRTLQDDFVLSEYASGLGAINGGSESDAEDVKAEPI